MSTETLLQIAAGIGAVVAIPMLYLGLKDGGGTLATCGFAVFTASMLVTPAIRLFSRGL